MTADFELLSNSQIFLQLIEGDHFKNFSLLNIILSFREKSNLELILDNCLKQSFTNFPVYIYKGSSSILLKGIDYTERNFKRSERQRPLHKIFQSETKSKFHYYWEVGCFVSKLILLKLIFLCKLIKRIVW